MVYEPESVWEFSTTGNITFGLGAAEELEAVVQEYEATNVLVVTDEGVAEAGIVDEVIGPIESGEYTVYDGVEPDPALSTFEEAREVATEVDPDFVVGIGGGSSMDVAKTTSIVHEHGGDILDYVAAPTGRGEDVPGPGVPTACLPTTAGTGSETSPVTVISLPDEDLKVGISSGYQRPNVALVDPGLTVSLPPGPTASSGMDALCHAIEAYVTRRYDAKPAPASRSDRPDYNGRSVLTDQFARSAIEHVGSGLRDAVNNGQDLEARRNMALGSLMAGISFTNAGLGATHAIAMAAGAMGAGLVAWYQTGKVDTLYVANGLLAGLVGITAIPDTTHYLGALAIGGLAGAQLPIVFSFVEKRMKIDDVCAVFPVHGSAGILGTLAFPFVHYDLGVPLAEAALTQFVGVVVIAAWTVGATAVVWYALKAAGQARVTPEHERDGLDISEHGVDTYPEFGDEEGVVADGGRVRTDGGRVKTDGSVATTDGDSQ